jgi:repressor LexA
VNLPPSPRQLEVLREIRRHHQAKGFPISIRELCDAMGIRSTNGVNDHLRALERKGLITREKQRARTLQLTRTGKRSTDEAIQ